MAKDKTSFVLYSDNKSIIDLMTNEQAGLLLKTLFSYVNDENPKIDESIKLVFEMIKLQLKRDLKKWENTVSERSISGRKGNLKKYNLDLFNLFEQGKYTLEQAENIAKNRKTSHSVANVAVNDSVSVSVNDNVNDNVILLKKETKINNTPTAKFSFFNSLIELGVEKQLVNDWLAVRKNKKLTNTETAFKNLEKEFEKCGKPIPVIIEKCVTESWGGFKASWDWKDGQTKNSEPIVAGRQTMETIKKNLDGSNLYVPGI